METAESSRMVYEVLQATNGLPIWKLALGGKVPGLKW
jgi:hypothetical protein